MANKHNKQFILHRWKMGRTFYMSIKLNKLNAVTRTVLLQYQILYSIIFPTRDLPTILYRSLNLNGRFHLYLYYFLKYIL